jgi:hypothetical protein
MMRASSCESKRHELSSSSRSLPLNGSIQAFSHGEPGSMKSEPALLNRHQSCTACATNSGTVVEAHVVRRPVLQDEAIQDIDDAVGNDATIDVDRECFAGKWDNFLTPPDDDRIFVDGDGEVRKTLASRIGEVRRELRCIVDGVTQIEKKPLGARKQKKL